MTSTTVYNLLGYLKTLLPIYNFSVNGFHDTTLKNAISINETTGTPDKWIDRTDWTFQIISKNIDPVEARKQLQDVYDNVDRFYDIILSEITIDSVVYTEVKAYQMTPLQTVTWFGYDGNGDAQYLFNLQIITR